MKREELASSVAADADRIKALFISKNGAYGVDKDALYNFTAGALLDDPTLDINDLLELAQAQAKTLLDYTKKHIVTIFQDGTFLTDKEYPDRCLDIAVYMLILRAIHNQTQLKIESPEITPIYAGLARAGENKNKIGISPYELGMEDDFRCRLKAGVCIPDITDGECMFCYTHGCPLKQATINGVPVYKGDYVASTKDKRFVINFDKSVIAEQLKK